MGLSDHVHLAAYAPRQIPGGQYPRLGRDHDAAHYSEIVRTVLRAASPSR